MFAAFSCLYCAATRGHFQTTDEVAVFQQTRSLWERGDLDVVPMINAQPGSDGRWYSVYHVGQSLVALPFYGAGKLLAAALDGSDWREVFAGGVIGDDRLRWSGEVEIFAVNLTSAFAMALLCAIFFWLSRALGAGARASLIATALVGTCTHVAGFAACFFTHALEALLLFCTFTLLVVDARAPDRRLRALAGGAAAFLILTRFQAVVALPALAAYLLWSLWWRGERRIFDESFGFFVPIVLALFVHLGVNWFKFGAPSFAGGHESRFGASLLANWYALFFSVGKSLFVFTPLLVLGVACWPRFRHRAEAWCVAGVALGYLLLYGKYEFWHGEWCFGPRYLAALVPLALLPLASFWEGASTGGKIVAGLLAAAGLLIEVLHVGVNFSYINHSEGYSTFTPPHGYLFVPGVSPIAAHWKALLAADYRVDPWLVTVYRRFGLFRTLVVALPLAIGFCASAWKLRREIL